MSIWLGLALIALLCAAWIGADMIRFGRAKHKAEHPTAGTADAGGVLYVQGGKTYYRMPKSGVVRKMADREWDLRPGSEDMRAFLAIQDQARAEHEQEIKAAKLKEVGNMREVAREEAKDAE